MPPVEWLFYAEDIDAILQLKQERRAVILAHNYQTPEIFHCVDDIVGDSLALARRGMDVQADVIVLAGVHFMAETAKLLNPGRTVLIPDTTAGCSLAESITPADVRALRLRYPGIPVVTYVNTSAAVKAASDICCTSGNARRIVEALGVPRVIMIPDEYLARNIAAETGVEIISWSGHCEVHQRFTPGDVRGLRQAHPGLVVVTHPECPPNVVAEADFSGSTAMMEEFVQRHAPGKIALIEDLGRAGDLTTDAIVPPGLQTVTVLVARQPGVVAGLDLAALAFSLVAPEVRFEVHQPDGSRLAARDIIATVRGPAAGILTAERVALNFLCHLSGVASATASVVDALVGTRTRVTCTCKTMPGLRAVQKYAVRAGGGSNHRFGLDDAVLIKDNHVAIAGDVGAAVLRARASVGHLVKIEVEVDTLDQLEAALAVGVDAVLLDNMDLPMLTRAVAIVAGRAVTEASGRITPQTAAAFASTGVDLISLGWLTHSAAVLDIGLDHQI